MIIRLYNVFYTFAERVFNNINTEEESSKPCLCSTPDTNLKTSIDNHNEVY